jgi:hypothetical protein
MRKNLRFIPLAALIAVFLLFSCNLDGTNEEPSSNSEITLDDTNYQGSAAAFRVRNDTSYTLVAIKNSVNMNNILGLIPAGAQNHGIRNNQQFFTSADAFPVILVTEEQFRNAEGNQTALNALNNNPFSRIFVFFNPNADPESPTEVYQISDHLGGGYKIRIENPTNYNVEIRLGGPEGPTFAYATAGMQSITLSVAAGEYEFYPVIRVFNRTLGRLNTFHPRNSDGNPWSFSMAISNPASLYTFNVQPAINQLNTAGMTIGVAWLSINNQNISGAIRLREGSRYVTDSIGMSLINNGMSRTIVVTMPSAGANAYAESVNISAYRVIAAGIEVPIETPDGGTNIVLNRDFMYVVDVTGDHNVPAGQPGSLRAVINIEGARRIELNDLD